MINWEKVWKQILAKRKKRGKHHVLGTGGAYASLCATCYREEVEILKSLSLPPARLGEEPEQYWHRIGAPFWDAWYEVALWKTKTAKEE